MASYYETRGKRYKIPKTMTTHWHNCSLTTWLFIPHYAVAAAKAWTNSFRGRVATFPKNCKLIAIWHLTGKWDYRNLCSISQIGKLSLVSALHCTAECKKGGFNWQTWSKWAACEFVLRKIIQLNASLHRNWGKNELLEKGGRVGSLWQKWP